MGSSCDFNRPARTRVLIVGDSLTCGAAEVRERDIVSYVTPNYVEQVMKALPEWQYFIDAQVLRTTDDVRNQIGDLLALHAPAVVLLQVGSNDADLDWRRFVLSEGKIARSRVPLERYVKNLKQICSAVLATGAQPVLADMSNHHLAVRGKYVSEQIGRDILPLLEAGGGQAETDRNLGRYRQAVQQLSEDMNLPLAGYGAAMELLNWRQLTGNDGTHLNAMGHRFVAEVMIATLKRCSARACAQVPA